MMTSCSTSKFLIWFYFKSSKKKKISPYFTNIKKVPVKVVGNRNELIKSGSNNGCELNNGVLNY